MRLDREESVTADPLLRYQRPLSQADACMRRARAAAERGECETAERLRSEGDEMYQRMEDEHMREKEAEG